MPILQKTYRLEVTPEQFITACSDIEIIEIAILLSSKKYDHLFDQLDNVKKRIIQIEDKPSK